MLSVHRHHHYGEDTANELAKLKADSWVLEEDEVDDSATLADTAPEDEAMFIKTAGGFDPCQRPRRVSPPALNIALLKRKKAVSLHSPLSPTPSLQQNSTLRLPSQPILPAQISQRSERRSSYTPQLNLQRIRGYDEDPFHDVNWQPPSPSSSYLPQRQPSSASSTTCCSTLSPQASFSSSDTSFSPIAASSSASPIAHPEHSSRFFRSALRKLSTSSSTSPVPPPLPRHAAPPPPWVPSSPSAPASTGSAGVAALPPAPAPTKSASLADKIKNRFQKKKNAAPRGGAGLPRSASLSSVTWTRLTTSFHGSRSPKREERKPAFQQVRFAKDVSVRETFSQYQYDRTSDPEAVCQHLTTTIATGIKDELNAYKLQEMPVHELSRAHTHFFF
ncbi:hypothetical protein BCR43DRAFT_285377 [Syncephalastrum racemosum]|uniref:Uncharacterized protein n=1 Tax=Syncephalastrum racemosum TaxID=13706 RepID=A0A1X2HEH9_SYNRA|nr:hypothetical protein BCR43DRAFT_285377 [Syncephalastrum racemosum]